jgi:hypothetical protein
MAISVSGTVEAGPRASPEGAAATEDTWLEPAPFPVARGLFGEALRAASMAWRSDGVLPLKIAATDEMALPMILEAWRSIERELAGMTGDGPDQELLEANATMLGAMYQRLYLIRMKR